MTELEHAHEAEIVQENPENIWNQCLDEWSMGASETIMGYLRQARAAAAVARVHGTSSITEFAKEVKSSKSWVYDLARVWWCYEHLLEDPNSSFSRRLESGLLTISHLIEATRAPDPIETLDQAEDEGLSSRAIKALLKEQEEKEAEVVKHTMTCPTCNGAGEIPVDSFDLGGGGEK